MKCRVESNCFAGIFDTTRNRIGKLRGHPPDRRVDCLPNRGLAALGNSDGVGYGHHDAIGFPQQCRDCTDRRTHRSRRCQGDWRGARPVSNGCGRGGFLRLFDPDWPQEQYHHNGPGRLSLRRLLAYGIAIRNFSGGDLGANYFVFLATLKCSELIC